MSGKGGGSAPSIDYKGAAEATAKGNLEAIREQLQANRVNQYTPWGSSTWTNTGRQFNQSAYDTAMAAYQQSLAQGQGKGRGGFVKVYDGTGSDRDIGTMTPYGGQGSGGLLNGVGKGGGQSGFAPPNPEDFYSGGDQWEQRIELSPEQQALFDQYNRLQQGLFGPQNDALSRVQQMYSQGFDTSSLGAGGTPLDMSGLPGAGTVYDPSLNTNNATDLILERVNPQLQQRNEALRAQLAQQGITQGSEAYNRAMMLNAQAENDAYNQASLAGIGLGMQQQGLQFGQQQDLQRLAAALQGQQFGQSEQQRQRQFQEQAYLRGLPLQELQALSGGTQVSMPQFSGFAQAGNAGGADYLGAANAQYQADLGRYNADLARQAQFSQGLGRIGGALGSYFGGPLGGISGALGGPLGGLVGTLGGTLLGGIFG